MNDAESFPTVALQYATRQSEFAIFRSLADHSAN